MALKHQVGVSDWRWCTMLSMTTGLPCRASCSGSCPAAKGRTIVPIMMLLSSFPVPAPGSCNHAGSCVMEWIQLPQKPPWHTCPYFSAGSIFRSAPLLPIVPAPRNVQAAMCSRSAGSSFGRSGKGFALDTCFSRMEEAWGTAACWPAV